MGDRATHCYIGIEPCGCISVVMCDSPDRKKDIAKEIAKLIADGCTIERHEIESIRPRLSFKGCDAPGCCVRRAITPKSKPQTLFAA